MNDPIKVVLKIETDSIAATKVIVLTLYELDTDVMQSFSNQPGEPSIRMAVLLLPHADLVIVQTDYAIKTLGRLYGLAIDPARVVDTHLLAKRLMPYQNHGMDHWAKRLGLWRKRFMGAPCWTPEAQTHCERDARLIGMIYTSLYEVVPA